jgi:hypothetical protein
VTEIGDHLDNVVTETGDHPDLDRTGFCRSAALRPASAPLHRSFAQGGKSPPREFSP